MNIEKDSRVVLTLDAGGTNFVFSALKGGKQITEEISLPSNANNLEKCLNTIFKGFETTLSLLSEPASAISFAFPGPADYTHGVVGKLGNLPAFSEGGVPLGPMLKEKFEIPVFMNNDGDLFAYGEAIAGFLPYVNKLLEKSGNPKRYKNLIALTFGTGFGAGLVSNGKLHLGDNSCGAEIFLLRGFNFNRANIEEEISIRGIKRFYSEAAGIPFEEAPSPKEIFEIGAGIRPGNKTAALEAYENFGRAAGDAIANAVTLIDAPVVIGGGIANAHPLFLKALVNQMNGSFVLPDGRKERRLIQKVFNFEEEAERKKFLQNISSKVKLPDSGKEIIYNPEPRICVGVSKLGTSKAIMLGAYAFALQNLEQTDNVE